MTTVVNSVNVADVPLDQPHLRNLYRLAKKRTDIDAEIVQAMIDAWRAGGTLNDIAKLASGELGRPYGVVATAASMDGRWRRWSQGGRCTMFGTVWTSSTLCPKCGPTRWC